MMNKEMTKKELDIVYFISFYIEQYEEFGEKK